MPGQITAGPVWPALLPLSSGGPTRALPPSSCFSSLPSSTEEEARRWRRSRHAGPDEPGAGLVGPGRVINAAAPSSASPATAARAAQPSRCRAASSRHPPAGSRGAPPLAKLAILALQSNQLTGAIPSTLGNLIQLTGQI